MILYLLILEIVKHLILIDYYSIFHTKAINVKYQLQHGMKNWNYLMGHILYQIFKTMSTPSKNIKSD